MADSVAGESLGKKIRQRRRAIDMTLQQLSEHVGLSISFLSQIERGISTPSLASLCNIAEALDTSVDVFVEPPLQSGPVSRQGERQAFSLGDARRTYELLGQSFPGAKLHPTLVRRPPGHVSELMHNEGEDFVYILEGSMLLEVDGERHILNKGDSMHFQSHLPHRSTTLGNEPTLELWVRTQPLFP
ncbi:transcriptional regulator with XRE-family HTH domain [Mesorhizobium soli]|jgi:transcriptional regulator with XRE-family HTH domain|uniref:helix-turn-helix domain-containing protein n=1 Tax=Pseudaminobacter soli (ex Li et al. 2025) TaxID=1295366 RepID=UPI002474BAF3|nr:XRE family transcriptional regulator [Mesorhizobium soli]MDH6233010.1 transcriptional regulator with XRE-family HTH domain [Mesorhizobium soli]